MERWCGKVALITGAATGIGKATVSKLLENGMKVVGCGRRLEALQELESTFGSKGELTIIPCDVSKEDDVISMFSKIKEKYGGVDVCINNAGLSKSSPILSGKSEDWQLMFDVNVIGVLRITREAVASMKSKGAKECHIININSLSGHRVLPSARSHVYASSKFALTAITQGTRHELLDMQSELNCRVSQISPGLVETPFIGLHAGEERAAAIFSQLKALEAEDIAQTVVYQLGLPAHAQVQDVLIRPLQQTS
ncbi:dehydrogenase/reductase SDR family member 11-like [Watersipora subatra]|uniref:dehydrogenase/reductase SDR family member 11-like n=1 Tax=Watersipora subatra TaxID=2589382 RepID=UPI00355B88D6